MKINRAYIRIKMGYGVLKVLLKGRRRARCAECDVINMQSLKHLLSTVTRRVPYRIRRADTLNRAEHADIC